MTPEEKIDALEEALTIYRHEMEVLKAQFDESMSDILVRAEERRKREVEAAGLIYIPRPAIKFTDEGFEFRHVIGWKADGGERRPTFVPEKMWVVCKQCGADFIAKEHESIWEQGAFSVSTDRSIAVTCKSCDRMSNYLMDVIPGWPGEVLSV